MTRKYVIATACICIALLAGCGSGNSTGNSAAPLQFSSAGNNSTGGGNSGHGRISTSSDVKARVLLGGTQQFTNSDLNATWAVNHVPGGNDVLGTISSTGLYTAPAVVPLNPVITIIADSQANNSTTVMQAEVGALTGTRFAYVSSATDNAIQIFTADGKTGVLQPVSIFSVGAGKAPAALALAPNGNFLYSLNRGTNDISVYAIDPSSGNLTKAGSVPVPAGPNAMVFSAKGEFAYVNLGSGSLSPLSGSSYAAGGGRIQSH